jgi:Holliday junction resolvase RusA-like endonuclease
VFFVEGRPAPKGSKNVGQHGQVYEQSPHVKLWVESVAMNCLRFARHRIAPGIAVGVDLVFFMQRAWRTPDGDKITRATWDGLVQGGLLADDKYIVRWSGRRLRIPHESGRFGCLVTVTREAEGW